MMGMAGAAAALPWGFNTRAFKFMTARAYPFAQSPTNIRKFVTTLPGLGPANAGAGLGPNNFGQYLPLAAKTVKNFMGIPTDTYKLEVRQFTENMHPDLPGPTSLWGYRDKTPNLANQKYLGGVVIATRGTPVMFTITNSLPNKSIIPTDPTIMGSETRSCGQLPVNRITTHLHGGLTPWFSDGTPFQWFTPNGMHGSSFLNVPGTSPPLGTATYYYPNNLSARMLWYHDHADGITRVNAYAGIASAFLVTDVFEQYLINNMPNWPQDVFGLGIPLVIQDKTFVPNNILVQDPSWQWGKPGSLWYVHKYEADGLAPYGPIPDLINPSTGKARWGYGPTDPSPMLVPPLPMPNSSVVAEGFFDTMMVNGAPYPVLNVDPRIYRFRVLNACQARFLHLNLFRESPTTPGEAIPPTQSFDMFQIGTEGGFLPSWVDLPNTHPMPLVAPYPFPAADPRSPTGGNYMNFNLLLAPAERADLLLDFSTVPGTSWIVYNDAPAPFPGGDGRNWYFTGDTDFSSTGLNAGGAPATLPGFGPNSQTIMKIVVSNTTPGPSINGTFLFYLTRLLGGNFTGIDPSFPDQPPPQQNPLLYQGADAATPGPVPCPAPPTLFAGAAVRRSITLNEDFDEWGRLIQRAGTTVQNGINNQGLPTYGRNYPDPPTEVVAAGNIEIWDIYNLTADTHPWHFHLVNVQVVQRASFDAAVPTFAPIPGTERLPDPNEYGWKETVRMNPVGSDPANPTWGEVTTVIAKFDLPVLPAAMGNPILFSGLRGINGHEYVHHCHILEHEEHDMMRPLVVV